MQQRSTNTITTTSSQRLRRIFMARAATVIVVVFLQRSKLHKHRLLYSRRLVPSLSVCLSSSLQSFLTFSSRSRLGTGDTRHRRSRSRGRWRGESEDLAKFGQSSETKEKQNFKTPLWTGDVTRTDALNMASFTSFFPRNVATSLIFLQTNLLGPLFSSQIHHKFVTNKAPGWAAFFQCGISPKYKK